MDNRRDFIKVGLAIGATAALSGVASALPNAPETSKPPVNNLAGEHPVSAEAGYKLIPRVAGYGDLTSPDTAHGLPMDVYRKDNQVYSWVTIPEHFAGWKDATTSYAHDGAVATILTTVAGFQAMISNRQAARSKSVTLNLVAPVPIGQRVQAEARIKERVDIRQMIVEASIYDADKRLLASATSLWELHSEKETAAICSTAAITAFNRNMEEHFANG